MDGTSLLALLLAFFFPAYADKHAEEIVKQEIMMHFMSADGFGIVGDFDALPIINPLTPDIVTRFLSSEQPKARMAGVKFFLSYVSIKRQCESVSDDKQMAMIMRKSLGKHLKDVVAGLEEELQDKDPKASALAAGTLLALQPDHKKAFEILASFRAAKGTCEDEEKTPRGCQLASRSDLI